MSFILNIDTASEKAHVSFAKDGHILHTLSSETQKEHASFLQTAIAKLIRESGLFLKDLDAVAITSGPGSYTGLRVGMASAKGLCYALKKPLITISTLEVLTDAALQAFPDMGEPLLFCPMIDARRMEVFTAMYKTDLTLHSSASALVLNEYSFADILSKNKVLFFGSGSTKWKMICKQINAIFLDVLITPESMNRRSYCFYLQNKFTDLPYSEPVYIKDFQGLTRN